MSSYRDQLTELKKHLSDQIHALDQSAIVAITDPKGVIAYVNQMFCDLSEYTNEELIGKTHALINSGFHDSSFFKDMWATIGSGQVWRGEVRNQSKSGSIYWVDTTIVPFLDNDHRITQYIAIRYDITARKQAEENLHLERLKLIESEKMAGIGVLSAGIAHELGNPLGAIRGRLEMLESSLNEKDFDAELAKSSVHKMIENVDRMSKIMRGLRSSTRDGSKDAKQKFDLAQLTGDILELSQQKCRKNAITVEKEGLNAPLEVMGRETEIGQIIVNLFNNAFDAVKDQANPRIRIALMGTEDWAQLKVSDSGGGVSNDLLLKIFDPFFTTKEVGQGTGLGLSISRSFAAEHGGRLDYEPGPPHSFVLSLPL